MYYNILFLKGEHTWASLCNVHIFTHDAQEITTN